MNKSSLPSFLPIGLFVVALMAYLNSDSSVDSDIIVQPNTTVASSEEFCAHDLAMQTQLASDPLFQDQLDAYEKRLHKHVKSLQNNATSHAPLMYTLPVVVHIVHDGGMENIPDAQVLQGIQDLNDAFANVGYYDQGTGLDTEVQFCLAQRTPDGSSTTGITRDQNTLTDMVMETQDIPLKDLNRWEPEDYINIWLVRSITSLSSGPGVAGYAYFPTSHGGPQDGIVMEANYFGSTPSNSAVTIHEMGHYLGLYHTFQGGCGNNDCTLDGDRVCDTPPDQSTAWVPCNSLPNTCATDAQSGFPTDVPDMITNYMDYSDLECYSEFTSDQTDRMHFAITDARATLLDSKGCTDPCSSDITAGFTANVTTIDAGGTVTFTNTSTNATIYDWRVDGTNFSSNPNPTYTFNAPGIYTIELLAFNPDPNCDDNFSMTIEVTCGVHSQFSISNLFPTAGQTVSFTNQSVDAINYNWLVNGVSQSMMTDFAYTFTLAGTYTVCLEASNAFCDDIDCSNLVVVDTSGGCPPPCAEICDNGLDDDNDGYVDCYDEDCPCNTDECTVTDLAQNFSTQLAWQSPDNMASVGGSPHVANMNPWVDSIPEILITHASTNIFSAPCQEVLIYKGDGSNAANPARVNIIGGFDGYPDPGPTVGDVNNDGIPELVIVNNNAQLQVYTNFDENAVGSAMDLWITSPDLADDRNRRSYLADFNSDGISEIYVGDDIYEFDFSGATPTLSKVLSGGGDVGQLYYAFFSQGGSSPVAADVLDPSHCAGDPDCNGIELVGGTHIYSVDMTTADGDGYEIKIQRDLNSMVSNFTFRDGYTVVGDVDLDGVMDIVVSSARDNQRGVYAWNRNGFLEFFQHPSNSTAAGGMPCIANVYNDMANGAAQDYPEIIVCCADWVNAYNLNAANAGMSFKAWWNLSTDDLSGITGTTIFDFNGDGTEEIVYRDEDNIRILYGGTAPFPPGVDNERNWDKFLAGSGTMDEHPIVADVDNDKQAEIIVTSYLFQGLNSPAGDYRGRLRIFEADLATGDPWMSARQVWNQYNYFVVNVEDDMGIPPTQQLHHLEFPQVGSGFRPLNKFLAQASLLNNDGQVYLPVPDATITVDDVLCGPDSVTVTVTVCNDGDALLPLITPIAFYIGDPATTAAPLHYVAQFGTNVQPDECETRSLQVPNVTGNIYVTVNDDGSIPTPYNFGTDFPVTNIVECVYINNAADFSFTLTPPNPPNLGPDISFCNNGTALLDAGPGWASYTWQDGYPEQVYTAWEAGTYWVDVTDACGSVYSDTIVITMDTSLQFDLGPDTLFCLGDTLTFSVPGFDSYEWLPNYEIDCDNCPTVNITPQADTTYTLVATDANGCLSVDSILLTIGEGIEMFDTVQICQGDSILLFGNYETQAGNYEGILPNSIGCDTNLTVTVELLPLVVASQNIQICTGDSVLIFGNYESQPGMYLDTLPATVGCDTAMTITLQLLPLVEASQNIQICTGDSVLIFGNYESQPGMFLDTLPATVGCDTAMTITLQLLPLVVASQNIQICTGDSVLIFGNYESQPGMFLDTLPAAVGCDTAMTITLDVLPLNTAAMNIDICEGDSTLIFGNWVSTPGIYVDTITSTNDCDTVMTITLQTIPLPTASQTIQICAGDSILLFGNYENTSGQYTGLLPSASGCDTVLTVTLDVTAPLSLSLDTEDSCPDQGTGSVIPNISNGIQPFDYQWSTNDNGNELNAVETGSYSLTITDAIGCTAEASAAVGSISTSLVDTETEDVSCFGDSDGIITITGFEAGSMFSFDGQFFTPDTQFINLPAEIFTLYVQTPEGCIVEQEVSVGQPPELVVTLPSDVTIELGDSVILTSQVSTLDTLIYTWTPSDWLSCVDCPKPYAAPQQTTTYTLSVVNLNGCDGESDIQVFVLRRVNVFVPNAFSPNGDGINDVFTIFSGTGIARVRRMLVFDRWGENVFESYNFPPNDPVYGWDGTFKSEEMNPAVFVWFAEVEMVDGTVELLEGDVMLTR